LRKEKLALIDQLEDFLQRHTDSLLVDDVHRCLGMLYSQVEDANPERPGHEIDWALKAKGVEHSFAISPARGVLYRRAVAALSDLKLREIQMRLDVAAILQKLRDHSPFPEREEYDRRRRWLAREIDEVELAAKENFNRPISPRRKLT
jgi:hypothetical protein